MMQKLRRIVSAALLSLAATLVAGEAIAGACDVPRPELRHDRAERMEELHEQVLAHNAESRQQMEEEHASATEAVQSYNSFWEEQFELAEDELKDKERDRLTNAWDRLERERTILDIDYGLLEEYFLIDAERPLKVELRWLQSQLRPRPPDIREALEAASVAIYTALLSGDVGNRNYGLAFSIAMDDESLQDLPWRTRFLVLRYVIVRNIATTANYYYTQFDNSLDALECLIAFNALFATDELDPGGELTFPQGRANLNDAINRFIAGRWGQAGIPVVILRGDIPSLNRELGPFPGVLGPVVRFLGLTRNLLQRTADNIDEIEDDSRYLTLLSRAFEDSGLLDHHRNIEGYRATVLSQQAGMSNALRCFRDLDPDRSDYEEAWDACLGNFAFYAIAAHHNLMDIRNRFFSEHGIHYQFDIIGSEFRGPLERGLQNLGQALIDLLNLMERLAADLARVPTDPP